MLSVNEYLSINLYMSVSAFHCTTLQFRLYAVGQSIM